MKKILACCLLVAVLLTIALPAAADDGRGRGYIFIVRDNYGVPHVFSNTKEGLGFGCGYAMAQDRLWQADLYRRQAFGSLAEFGLASINSDYRTRTTGYSKEELAETFEKWVPINRHARLKEMFEAYLDGLNLYISEALDAYSQGDPSLMPVEYLPGVITPDGLPLEPFTIEDSVAITVMMAWRFGGGGGGELGNAARLQALQAMYGDEVGWEIFNDLYPQVDPGAPVTIPSESPALEGVGIGGSPALPSTVGDVYREYEEAEMSQMRLFESLGLPTEFGSNAWMVSPWKSESKDPLQVGGPQMGHSIPQIVLEVGLHGAGINAVGMMMPQAPSILIGVSEHGAWTSTSGASDLIDTYVEVLNPLNQYQYWYNGEWVDMEKRTERIYGYKKQYYEDRDIYRTIHGPIVGWDLGNNLAYSMKLPYYKNELAAEEGWSLFQEARNIEEMEEAVKTIEPSHNFYWIDRRGNVGYWHAGTFPIKPTTGKDGRLIDDRFPLWGTGEEEWVGVTGFEEMPKLINPEQGFLANWNNKPIADWPYRESDWGEVHGVSWIQAQLAAGDEFSFEDMNRINRDTGYNHAAGMYFLDYLTEAAKTDPSIPAEVIDALEAWDHLYNDFLDPKYPDADATYDDPGLTIFNSWFGKIDDEIFDDDLPPGVGAGSSTLLHVFDGPDSKLPLNYDYLNGEDRDEVIVRVLKEALTELEAYYGSSDVSKWLTPVRTVTFSRLGALPAPTMHAMNRGTYNHIAEMPRARDTPPHAVDIIPPGQSGFMNFLGQYNHAYDQLPLYQTWTYKPMLYGYGPIMAVAESTTILEYP